MIKKVKVFLMNLYYKSNNIKEKFNSKRGSELAQTIFITGIMVIIIATAFFPQMKELISKAISALSDWFDSLISKVTVG